MPIILSHPMTSQEIRVLQEYRRINSDTMALPAIQAIKQPDGGGALPLSTLVQKGYLDTDASGQTFTLTAKGKEFLSHDIKPGVEETGASPAIEV